MTDFSHELPKNCAPVLYHALKLNGEAGEVAEDVGKMYRDDRGILTEKRKAKLEKELGDALWYLSACATHLGLSLEDIANDNLDKLSDRMERGVLHGDGSDR
jgi:NTP pyrophosphatase (non-canonical NTP hydrolase)